LFACAAGAPEPLPLPDAHVLAGGTVVGLGPADVEVRDGRITAVGAVDASLPRLDVQGRWLVPGFIDAHVHLIYAPRGEEMVQAGIAGAVDWAAPMEAIGRPVGPTTVWAGPILTAPGGYPTEGWGRDGYGLVCSDATACAAAVDQVLDGGARVVKIAIGASGPQLSEASLRAIVERAHSRGVLVGAHALDNNDARLAGTVGADILVHAPSGPLSDDVVALWADRAVISTISAFNGVDATRQLHGAGATVLYGTDFGNTGVAGISGAELDGLGRAGLDAADILQAGTRAPAMLFGLEELGAIAVGKEASLLVLERDPLLEVGTLQQPAAVIARGLLVRGSVEAAE
jgi:imidazolonepropionase-like amidohydrolase